MHSRSSSISSGDWDIVPDFLASRDEWFSHWDNPERGGNGTGRLSEKQVARALSRTFREFEKQSVDSIVHEVWADFDDSKCGLLGKDALMKPQTGLVDTAHMVMLWSS